MRCVYFMRPAGKPGPIKIGCSANPDGRARQISSDRKERIEVVASVPGDFRDEQRLHRQFARQRIEQEWFRPTPSLLAVIGYAVVNGTLPGPKADDRVVVMARMYAAGSTLQEIGQKYGISRERVRQILRKHEHVSLGHREEHRRHADPITDNEREFARLYELGTPPRILRKLFPNLQTAAVLRRTDTPTKRKGHWLRGPQFEARCAQIADLYRSGVKVREIAAQVGLAATEHVYYYLGKAGIRAGRVQQNRLDAAGTQHVAELYRNGATISAIAREVGSACPTIRHALDRAGIVITREESERRRIVAVQAANRRRYGHGRIAA